MFIVKSEMEGNQDGDDVLLQPSVTSTIRTSTEQSSASSHLSRYGSPQPLPPRDDAVQYPPDDNHGFFAQVNIILHFLNLQLLPSIFSLLGAMYAT